MLGDLLAEIRLSKVLKEGTLEIVLNFFRVSIVIAHRRKQCGMETDGTGRTRWAAEDLLSPSGLTLWLCDLSLRDEQVAGRLGLLSPQQLGLVVSAVLTNNQYVSSPSPLLLISYLSLQPDSGSATR